MIVGIQKQQALNTLELTEHIDPVLEDMQRPAAGHADSASSETC